MSLGLELEKSATDINPRTHIYKKRGGQYLADRMNASALKEFTMLIDALGDVGEGTSQVTRPPDCLPEFQEPTSRTPTGYVLSSI